MHEVGVNPVVLSPPSNIKNHYSWVPLYAAIPLALLVAGGQRVLEFWSLPGFGDPWAPVRTILDLFLLPCLMVSAFLFVIAAVIATAVVLVRRQFRRAVSLACAAAAVPSLIFGQAHLAICSPYFWYVLTHETQLKAKALALAESQSPTFAVIETRDVSRGLVVNPAIFASVVYDEAGEAGLEGRLRAWRRFNFGGDAILKIERLLGQFYLVETTIR